jgi:glycerophosphoryl diester phosphodiesterase
MGFYRWSGTELEAGKVYQWDDEELLPGTVKQWPWVPIGPPAGPEDLDGGAATTTSWPTSVDGGAPNTTFSSSFDLVANMPLPVYVGHRFGRNEACQDTRFAADYFFTKFTSPYQHAGECDLHVLSDGTTIVLSHDATVTYGGSSTAINTLTPAQWDTVTMQSGVAGVANQPASFWDYPDLPNKSVASRWASTRVLVPEMKNAAVATPLTNWIDANNAYGNIIVQWAVYSLSSYTTTLLPMAEAGIYTMPVCYSAPGGGTIPSYATMAADGVYGVMVPVSPTWASLASVVSAAHAEGLKVFTFNSNTAVTMQAQVAAGVDGPLSDNPTNAFPTTLPADPTVTGDEGYDGGTP